jgi:hypothetical protein
MEILEKAFLVIVVLIGCIGLVMIIKDWISSK